MKKSLSFTLIEIIVAIAVLLFLAAILAPVIMSAKNSAKGANDISNMRQCGIAAALYMESWDVLPRGCPDLVNAGLVPVEMCAAMNDPYPEGLANRLVVGLSADSSFYATLDVEYRHSFVGPREYGISGSMFAQMVNAGENIGWLVDLSTSDSIPEIEPANSGWDGRYRRLMIDGSVQWRNHKTIQLKADSLGSWSPIMLFGDFSDEWLKKQLEFYR